MQHYLTCVFACLVLSIPLLQAEVTFTEDEIPPDLLECLHTNTKDITNTTESTEVQIYGNCLRQFLWKADMVQWEGFNITQKDMDFVNSLSHSLVHTRVRRQTMGNWGRGNRGWGNRGRGNRGRGNRGRGNRGRGNRGRGNRGRGNRGRGNRGREDRPRSGFRVRQEYRRLSSRARRRLHSALNTMKTSGQYDTFANLHRGIVITSAHSGPNFLGWHRVYLSLVEEALRRINRRVVLPYWDSSLDFDMVDPAQTIVFSPPFFGNGDGFVTSGPFRNWQTSTGPLARNIGGGSRLFSKTVIRQILTRCRTREITFPTAEAQFDLEGAHGGPHVWIGGQMQGLETAAHDPCFFLHHAFVDYIWELFRRRQARRCRVNPSRDYPPSTGQHAPQRRMDGLPRYRNIDGYRRYWTRFWYRYEPSPTCSRRRPRCGSRYLRCDRSRGRCVSIARTRTAAENVMASSRGFAAMNAANDNRGQVQASRVTRGPVFRAPPAEPRTQAARMALSRRKRQAPTKDVPVNTTTDVRSQQSSTVSDQPPPPSRFEPRYRAPPADPRNPVVTSPANMVRGSEQFEDNFPPYSPIRNIRQFLLPEWMSYLPDFNYRRSSSRQSSQRSSAQNNSTDRHPGETQPVYVPVKIIFKTPQSDPNRSSFDRRQMSPFDIFNDLMYPSNQPSVCGMDRNGVTRVSVQSQGVNNLGAYTGFANLDARYPISTTMAYVGIQSPDAAGTEALLAAYDACGNMCQPLCLITRSKPYQYTPCTGVLKIGIDDPAMYGRTINDAVNMVWKGTGFATTQTMQHVQIIFHCSVDETLQWSNETMIQQ